MSDIELASETEINLYKERIEKFILSVNQHLADEPKYNYTVDWWLAQAYIAGFKDADLGRE